MHDRKGFAIAPIIISLLSYIPLIGAAFGNNVASSSSEVIVAQGGAASLSALERGIVAEMNRARTNPAAYAATIQNQSL